MSIARLIEPQSEQYREMREDLRGKARAYALDRVGGSPSNQRARTMLAAAFDAGVSKMVEVIRDELMRPREDESEGFTRAMEALFAYNLAVGEEEVIETIQALADGRAKVIAVRASAEPSRASLATRSGPLAGVATVARASEGVATAEPETRPANSDTDEPVRWKVGDNCVWIEHYEYGTARIKWISNGTGKPGTGHEGIKRCKLYYERFDRTEDAWIDELEPVGVR